MKNIASVAASWFLGIAFALACLYLGIAGILAAEVLAAQRTAIATCERSPVKYQGIEFANAAQVNFVTKTEHLERIAPWAKNLPDEPVLRLTIPVGIGFGGLGAVGAIILRRAKPKQKAEAEPTPPYQFLIGMFLGPVCVLAVSVIQFGLTMTQEAGLRPVAAALFALLTGLFSTRALEWLTAHVNKVFR